MSKQSVIVQVELWRKIMEKLLKIGKTSAVGSLHLFIGKLSSTVILALGTIVIGFFILDTEYGLYTIALIPSTTILLFQDWGVSSAMIRFIARNRADNRERELWRVIIAGLTFTIATGLLLTFISILTANFVATSIFGNPDSAFLISFASITIVSLAAFTAATSIFIAFEKMKLNTYALICSAVVQSAFAPLLVYLGYGATGAIIGFTVASVISGLFATLLMYFSIFRKLNVKNEKFEIRQTLKPLLAYGFPLATGSILGGVIVHYYSFLMASYCDVAQIGNLRIANNFEMLLTLIIFPISTVLFPAFSKLNPKNELNELRSVFASSIKYGSLLLVPASLAMFVLAEPLIGTLYGDKWPYAPTFLALGILGNLLVVLGSMSVSILFSATGETKLLLKLNALTLSVGVPLGLLLVPTFDIIGVIIGPTIAGVPSVLIGLYLTKKRYGMHVDSVASVKILLVSLFAAVSTYILVSFITASYAILLAIGGLFFLAIYLTFAPMIGAINQMDINNMRTMFSGLGLFSKLLEVPLTIMDKVAYMRFSLLDAKIRRKIT